MPIVWIVVFQLIIFIAILFLLKRFVYKDISVVLQRLKKLQAENLQREEDLKRKIGELKKEYELKMAGGQEEIEKLKNDANVDAQMARGEILEKAKREGEGILKEALMKKDAIRLELEAELNRKAVLLAQKIIVGLFSSHIVEEIHRQLVDEAVKEVMQLNSSQIKENVEQVIFITAIPLSSGQREKCTNFISGLVGATLRGRPKEGGQPHRAAPTFREEIDKTIIAGLIVKLGDLMLDASLNNRLLRITEMLREAK
ncbi:MAG: F0F1 ATP synthase subunit delta [bacterium]